MEIKDIKVGDKVQLRKDIPEKELTELLGSHGLTIGNAFELQRRGEVTVKDIQEGNPGKEGDDWNSITLEEMGYYWPIELFEPVNIPNAELSKAPWLYAKVIKSKEEQVQEDILVLKGIAERYRIHDLIDETVEWLCDFGQKYLIGD